MGYSIGQNVFCKGEWWRIIGIYDVEGKMRKAFQLISITGSNKKLAFPNQLEKTKNESIKDFYKD